MRATETEYLQARNASRPPRFSTWARGFLASATSDSEYYDFAKDIISYVPAKQADRKAFDRDAVKFVTDYPNKAFRKIQEDGYELSTPDLVSIVKKNAFVFIPLLTREQKIQYKGAEQRLLRVSISLNRDKITKKSFILISQLHNLNKRIGSELGGQEPPLYTDHIYAKYMKQVLSDYYDITDIPVDKLWPYWIKFLEEQPIE